MSAENLQGYVDLHADKILRVRDYYYQLLKQKTTKGGKEVGFSFSERNMYQCWVNYAPFFFRELMIPFMELIESGFNPEELSQFAENKFRVHRYFTQMLIPGAYLDQSIPFAEKKNFLDTFAVTANTVLEQGETDYPNADNELLYTMEPIRDPKRIAVGNLISALTETCDAVYFGEQPLGFTAYGYDRKVIPDHYALFQDFDINLGPRRFPTIGRIETVTVYPVRTIPPFIIDMYSAHAHIFFHRFWQSKDWIVGRPSMFNLAMASVRMNGREMETDEINQILEHLFSIISLVSASRKSMSQRDLNLEYLSTQSRVIKNLRRALGQKWRLSKDAEEAAKRNTIVKRLKKEWGLDYSFEVSYELIKRSVEWAKTVAT